MITPGITSIDQLNAGMEAILDYTFSEKTIEEFAQLTGDRAPVHFETDFARAQGFPGRIVFGFHVASIFSGLLGMNLPGPNSVIHSVIWKMARPVSVGETIHFRVIVKHVSASVQTVVLTLAAINMNGETVLTGEAQCGFMK